MRIEVRRSGGFAGVTRTFAVDTAALPAARAAEIERIAGSLAAGRSPSADGFAYQVTVDGATIEVADAEELLAAMR